MERIKSTSPLLHLNLDNFTSPEAEDSRYVLTSPRSLESCAKLGVKPVDLLFRSFTEFINENQGSPLEEVSVLFEEHEKQRRERLRMCREERERIIQEDLSRISSLKSFTALETIQNQCTELKTKPIAETDDSIHSKSETFPMTRGHKFPHTFSLADLRRSPATERRLKILTEEINRKLNIALPEKDHKIASLMLAKHEERQIRLRQSQSEKEHREEEQRNEELRRAHFEKKRRKQLLEHIRQWQEDLEERRRRKQQEEAMIVERQKQEVLHHEERWRRSAKVQEASRRFKHQSASKDAKERKCYQERLLREKERSEEVQREKELLLAHEKEKQASRSKQIQETRAKTRLQQENQRELLKHLLLKKEAEEKERAEKEMKRKHLDDKLKRSEVNHALVLEERVEKMRLHAAKEEQQMRMALQRAGRENRERLEIRRTLVQRCKLRTEHAVLQAQEKLRRRAQNIKTENQEKEKHHRRLQERVLEEEKAQWEEKCTAVMMKEERREKLQKDRAEAQERSRKVARASCYMRDRVREQTAPRTFDQMAREAELTAQLSLLNL
ncbi:coiled-coil domain-containing protein 177 [Danio aesculapii]|uniref:coiled-coil domain-containing protein 177 n=1 Tax=Danio aesculapii TaxID=1142201 RepID=UPI0024C0856E|nr:coiled-coil domain-containing protein 177 [Danio aesculapii]